ncbi:hypothetical protein MKX08_002236 [Trichoderma sp. CBMAI-0020]|nr:hypothetical protein MKX08_002236 [Trichoderma sp. CBMAI-0020]
MAWTLDGTISRANMLLYLPYDVCFSTTEWAQLAILNPRSIRLVGFRRLLPTSRAGASDGDGMQIWHAGLDSGNVVEPDRSKIWGENPGEPNTGPGHGISEDLEWQK